MTKIINIQNIKSIKMHPIAFTRCEIGGDFYKNEMEVTIVPDKVYPDYTEVQEWTMNRLDGETLNIEDVVAITYAFIKETYEPKSIHIVNHVTGCRTHFDVTVEK